MRSSGPGQRSGAIVFVWGRPTRGLGYGMEDLDFERHPTQHFSPLTQTSRICRRKLPGPLRLTHFGNRQGSPGEPFGIRPITNALRLICKPRCVAVGRTARRQIRGKCLICIVRGLGIVSKMSRTNSVVGAAAGLLTLALLIQPLAAQSPPQRAADRIIPVPADGVRHHSAVVTAIALLPDGKKFAAAGDDHVVRVYDLRSGQVIQRLVGHQDWVRALAVTPDGSMLFSAGNDRQIRMWDLSTGRSASPFAEQQQAIASLAISHDGQWLAAAGFEDRLHIYRITDHQRLHELGCPCSDMRAVAISADDRFVAAGGRNGMVRVWDMASGSALGDTQAHRQRVRCLAFDNAGQRLISGGEDRTLRIWNWQTDGQVVTLPCSAAKVLALTACGPQLLASAGSDNAVRVWDLARLREVEHLVGHAGSVAALDFANGILVSGGYDTSMRMWSIAERPDEPVHSARRIGGVEND